MMLYNSLGGDNMPFITIDGPKVNKETKEKLVKEMTETVSGVLHMPKEHISIIIRENATDNIGQGGKLLTEIIKESK